MTGRRRPDIPAEPGVMEVYGTRCQAPDPASYVVTFELWNERTLALKFSPRRLIVLMDQLNALLAQQRRSRS
jgi:hypothetical protein